MRRLSAVPLLLAFLAFSAAADGDRGRALYQAYCSQCHGVAGNGGGINAPHMSVVPRDHTDRSEMSGRSDADLARVVKGGGKAMNQSILMPAWGAMLTDEDVEALVRHMRVLCCEG